MKNKENVIEFSKYCPGSEDRIPMMIPIDDLVAYADDEFPQVVVFDSNGCYLLKQIEVRNIGSEMQTRSSIFDYQRKEEFQVAIAVEECVVPMDDLKTCKSFVAKLIVAAHLEYKARSH